MNADSSAGQQSSAVHSSSSYNKAVPAKANPYQHKQSSSQRQWKSASQEKRRLEHGEDDEDQHKRDKSKDQEKGVEEEEGSDQRRVRGRGTAQYVREPHFNTPVRPETGAKTPAKYLMNEAHNPMTKLGQG